MQFFARRTTEVYVLMLYMLLESSYLHCRLWIGVGELLKVCVLFLESWFISWADFVCQKVIEKWKECFLILERDSARWNACPALHESLWLHALLVVVVGLEVAWVEILLRLGIVRTKSKTAGPAHHARSVTNAFRILQRSTKKFLEKIKNRIKKASRRNRTFT